jgi:hypothetical protein
MNAIATPARSQFASILRETCNLITGKGASFCSESQDNSHDEAFQSFTKDGHRIVVGVTVAEWPEYGQPFAIRVHVTGYLAGRNNDAFCWERTKGTSPATVASQVPAMIEKVRAKFPVPVPAAPKAARAKR